MASQSGPVDEVLKTKLREATQAKQGIAQCAVQSIMAGGSKLVQDFKPIRSIHAHLCAFHVSAHDIGRQVEAHHYCSALPNGMHQCVIYDSPHADARLIGIEYLISAEMFAALPPEEKRLWHSHVGEVKMGLLTMPGVSETLATPHLKHIMNMYGKIIHTWPVELGLDLPIGPPQLMVSFVKEDEVKPELLVARDMRYGISTSELANGRAGLQPKIEVDALVDTPNKTGRGFELEFKEVPVKPWNGEDCAAGDRVEEDMTAQQSLAE